jgi:hypothetical protein
MIHAPPGLGALLGACRWTRQVLSDSKKWDALMTETLLGALCEQGPVDRKRAEVLVGELKGDIDRGLRRELEHPGVGASVRQKLRGVRFLGRLAGAPQQLSVAGPPLLSELPRLVDAALADAGLREKLSRLRCEGEGSPTRDAVRGRSAAAFIRALCRQPMDAFRQQLEQELWELEAQRRRVSVVERLSRARPGIDAAAVWLGSVAGMASNVSGLPPTQATLLGLGVAGAGDLVGRLIRPAAEEQGDADREPRPIRRAALGLAAELAAILAEQPLPALTEADVVSVLRKVEMTGTASSIEPSASLNRELERLTADALASGDHDLHATLYAVDHALGLVRRWPKDSVARHALLNALHELAYLGDRGERPRLEPSDGG